MAAPALKASWLVSEMESGTEAGSVARHMDPKRKLPSFHMHVNCSIAEEALEADHEAWVQIPVLPPVTVGHYITSLRLSVLICIMGIRGVLYHMKAIVMWKWHPTYKVPINSKSSITVCCYHYYYGC